MSHSQKEIDELIGLLSEAGRDLTQDIGGYPPVYEVVGDFVVCAYIENCEPRLSWWSIDEAFELLAQAKRDVDDGSEEYLYEAIRMNF